MPTSFRENIPQILKIVEEVNPQTVLDVGFGRGKYGFLIKEYYPEIMIDGMEIFEPYLNSMHDHIYFRVINEDALITKTDFSRYELILLIDVIEHWTLEEGKAWLDKVIAGGSKVLVSTPRSVAEQGAEHGNERERHISQWQGEYFKQWKHKEYPNELSFTFLLG